MINNMFSYTYSILNTISSNLKPPKHKTTITIIRKRTTHIQLHDITLLFVSLHIQISLCEKEIKLEYTFHCVHYIYAFYGGNVDNILDRYFHRLVIDTPYIITYFNFKVCIYPGKCLSVKDNVKWHTYIQRNRRLVRNTILTDMTLLTRPDDGWKIAIISVGGMSNHHLNIDKIEPKTYLFELYAFQECCKWSN